MGFNKLSEELLQQLAAIVGAENVLVKQPDMETYSRDETESLQFYPEVVVKPVSTEQISSLLRFCNQHNLPITPRGAGTGLAGGALPVFGGVLLSLEKLNKIIEIDERNLQATVEAGVITQVFMDAVAEKGLLYPVDPSSKGSCFIGGNIACGAGGPRVVKYGTIREYVLNLEVVLPSGEVIWTGANTLKNASGYSLTQLMIGSEGTLGIITKAVLKLMPMHLHNVLMMVSFPSNEQACAAVSAIFRAGVIPSALEFMERKGVEWVINYDRISFDLKADAAAFLLIEVDGNNMELLLSECEKINEVLEMNGCLEVQFADTSTQKDDLWRIRRLLPVSIKANAVYKKEDTVVPRAQLPQLIQGIKEIGGRYGFQSVCFGHAGDGNLHVNIIKDSMSDEDWNTKLNDAIKEILQLTVGLGGTISGEHGIGLVQKEFMPIKFSNVHLNIMRGIKQVFDPNGILNPGKIFKTNKCSI